MHEYSIVQSLIDRVEAEAQARQAIGVQHLRVRIGELAGVDPELLASAYAIFREHTICSAADLEIRTVEARWVCPDCDQPLEKGAILRCPVCEVPARLAAGDEIMLDQIELEVP